MNEFGGVTGEEAMRGFEAGRAVLAAGGFTIGGGDTVDDLLAFIRQQLDARDRQLDEDERVALKAAKHGATWRDSEGLIYPSDESRHPGALITGVYGDLEDEIAVHVARWDPARVLDEVKTGRAEVEAKRRILDGLFDEWGMCRDDIASGTAKPVLALLAQPYAGRPGWRQEWAIEPA